MGAFITIVLVFSLGIGLFGLIITAILKVLKKKTKVFSTHPNDWIILFLFPFVISIIGILFIRYMIKKDSPILEIKLYWEYEDNNDKQGYFIYNDRKYIFLTDSYSHKPNSREIDKPVANIIESKNIESEKNILSRLFMCIYGIINGMDTLYTIKGYPDDSLLIVNRFRFVYCEEEKYSEINNYYDNIDNYKYYATYGHFSDETGSVELYDNEIIKEIYTYIGSDDLIQHPSEEECDYIFIFGISNDGILIKDLASIIIYNNQPYKEFGYFSEEEVKGMAVLEKSQSEYINKIILENRWKK